MKDFVKYFKNYSETQSQIKLEKHEFCKKNNCLLKFSKNQMYLACGSFGEIKTFGEGSLVSWKKVGSCFNSFKRPHLEQAYFYGENGKVLDPNISAFSIYPSFERPTVRILGTLRMFNELFLFKSEHSKFKSMIFENRLYKMKQYLDGDRLWYRVKVLTLEDFKGIKAVFLKLRSGIACIAKAEEGHLAKLVNKYLPSSASCGLKYKELKRAKIERLKGRGQEEFIFLK